MGMCLCAFFAGLCSCDRKKIKFVVARSTETLNSPEKGARFFRKIWDKDLLGEQEQVNVIFMDRKYRPIAWECIHTGGVCRVVIDIPVLMKYLVQYKPYAIFIAHNHPSGRTKPSLIDEAMTRKIAGLCADMNVELSDHIILTKTKYVSFRERGLLD